MPHRILIVEDYHLLAELLEMTLTAEGYEVTLASDGCKGLELAKSGSFDLVVLDLIVPCLDGVQVVRALAEEPDAPPVIALSGSATAEVAERVFGAGACDVLRKPIEADRLLDCIRRALAKTSLDAQPDRKAATAS